MSVTRVSCIHWKESAHGHLFDRALYRVGFYVLEKEKALNRVYFFVRGKGRVPDQTRLVPMIVGEDSDRHTNGCSGRKMDDWSRDGNSLCLHHLWCKKEKEIY